MPVFHKGEREAQSRAGYRLEGAPIRDFLPDQHRTFFPLLPFLPVASMGSQGMPAATVLTGAPGFVSSPDPQTLAIGALPRRGEPFTLEEDAPLGILGIDLATRRRNRANGHVISVTPSSLVMAVEQSFGNCPKYIQPRQVFVEPQPRPPGPVERLLGLDEDARSQIREADTFFVASSSGPEPLEAGGVDISHRGGRPGFVQVDGNRLTIPDYSGNLYFNTLGNFIRHPRAALIFVDFASGGLLHLDGIVSIDWERPDGIPGAERMWSLEVESVWRAPSALPLRWTFKEA
jgi:predicted pyridoxine 5'-phosphate oxidase superfamily flavin-nucleotide-binding protein